MRIFCPKCSSQIDQEKINVQENICACPSCNEVFKLSEVMDQDTIDDAEKLLRNPPKGAWVKKDKGQEIIGVSIKSKTAVFLFFFTLAFSSFSAFAFLQILQSKSVFSIIFMLPFIIASIYLWIELFFLIFGKIEIVIHKKEPDYIFTGIGSAGKKRYINWTSIKNIYSKTTISNRYDNDIHVNHTRSVHTSTNIHIEGDKTIKIPISKINEEKAEFLLKVLKYYKEQKIRFQHYF